MKEGIALVDGDIVAFKAAFSAEYMTYDLQEEGLFRYKKDVTNYIKGNFEDDEIEILLNSIVPIKVVEPIQKCYDAASQIIDGALNTLGVNSYEVYISGSGNFRESVPYPVKYKGNRSDPKPVYYESIREYLKKTYNAQRVDGMETDDMLCIRQHEIAAEGKDSIICSIDKDLLQVEGYHYNFDAKEIIKINKNEAVKNLAIQLLTGDRVDNIIGLKGVANKTAIKLLEGLETAEELYQKVKELYQKEWPETWQEMFEANMMLLMLKVVR